MQNDVTKKTKWAPKFILAGILIFFGVSAIFFATSLQKQYINLKINNNVLVVEIAKTSQKRAKGLCCRDTLDGNAGMLFIYDKPGLYSFWMKDTRIPLDMFWINSRKEVVHIERNVQPNTYPKSFVSKTPAQYVLETNAGYADAKGIKVGDIVQF